VAGSIPAKRQHVLNLLAKDEYGIFYLIEIHGKRFLVLVVRIELEQSLL
jgi:hypothetical protein